MDLLVSAARPHKPVCHLQCYQTMILSHLIPTAPYEGVSDRLLNFIFFVYVCETKKQM